MPRTTLLAITLAAGLSTGALAQTKYTVTNLGTLPGGAAGSSSGMSIANLGPLGSPVNTLLVVGCSSGARVAANLLPQLPFVWSPLKGMQDASAGLAVAGVANDVNMFGWYCGQMTVGGSNAPKRTAFLGGTTTNAIIFLPPLGGAVSAANALNDARATVGASTTPAGATHATLWPFSAALAPVPIDLGTLGGKASEALGINAKGWIVGGADNGAGVRRAFVSIPIGNTGKPGPLIDLGAVLKDGPAGARDVNELGQIVGWSAVPSLTSSVRVTHAALWSFGNSTVPKVQDLGVLQNTHRASDALGINARGQVVGWSGEASLASALKPGQSAFLWEKGAMADLNSRIPPGSGWHLLAASEINDQGQIVGWGLVRSSTASHASLRAFLLTPVP